MMITEDDSDDCSDDNESFSGIEPVDMTLKDDKDEDDDEDEDDDLSNSVNDVDEDESFLQKIERNLKEETSEIKNSLKNFKDDQNMLYNNILNIVKYLTHHDLQEMRDIIDELAENAIIEEEVALLEKLIPTFLDNTYTDISPIEKIITEIKTQDEEKNKGFTYSFHDVVERV